MLKRWIQVIFYLKTGENSKMLIPKNLTHIPLKYFFRTLI